MSIMQSLKFVTKTYD